MTVGGIRSTGLSNCLAIAKYVRSSLADNLKVKPSGHPRQSPGRAVWWKTDRGTIALDGAEYTVTHPISKFGLFDKPIGNKL